MSLSCRKHPSNGPHHRLVSPELKYENLRWWHNFWFWFFVLTLCTTALFSGLLGWSYVEWRNESDAHNQEKDAHARDLDLERLCSKLQIVANASEADIVWDQHGDEYLTPTPRDGAVDIVSKCREHFEKDLGIHPMDGSVSDDQNTFAVFRRSIRYLRPRSQCKLDYMSSEGRCDAGDCRQRCLQSITQKECNDNRNTISKLIGRERFCHRPQLSDDDLCYHRSSNCQDAGWEENPTTLCEGELIYRSVATPVFSS